MWVTQCHKPVVSQSQKNPIHHWILMDINGNMDINVGKTMPQKKTPEKIGGPVVYLKTYQYMGGL